MCQVSHASVMWRVSHVTCHMSLTPTASDTKLLLLSPLSKKFPLFVHANSVVRPWKFCCVCMQIPCMRQSKFRCVSMQILLWVHANSPVRPYKFCCASIQIPLCVHANSVVCPCKFPRATMQTPFCLHEKSALRPWKWVGKTNKSFFRLFYQFWAKVRKSETNVLS